MLIFCASRAGSCFLWGLFGGHQFWWWWWLNSRGDKKRRLNDYWCYGSGRLQPSKKAQLLLRISGKHCIGHLSTARRVKEKEGQKGRVVR